MNRQAEHAIIKARVALVMGQPFYGTLAQQLEIVEITDPADVPTMATDGERMFYHPSFVLGLSEPELIGVVAHEVSHCAYEHMTRRGTRDPQVWNWACVKADTLISTQNGEVAIEEINAGDLLKTPLGSTRVLTVATSRKKVLELTLNNGYKLCCSSEHRIMTNEGFIPAGKIKKGATVLVDTRKSRAVAQYGSKTLTAGNSRKNRVHIPTGRSSSTALRTKRNKNFLGKENISHSFTTEQPSSCIPSWHSRWGRNNFVFNAITQWKEKVRAPLHNSNNHQSALTLLAGVSWFQGADKTTELKPEVLLELHNVRVQSGHIVDLDLTIFGHQETARKVLDHLHSTEESAAFALRNLTRDAESVGRIEGFECARVTAVTKTSEEAICYDLTTDKHCYVANGIVVHNCDYVINADLLAAGFTLPKERLYNKRFDNMSTYEVYEILMKEQPPKLFLQKDKGKDVGGCGAVRDAAAGHDSQKAEKINEVWESAVRTALAVTKAGIGHIPKHMQRLVKQLQEPKISWRALTRQFIDGTMLTDYSWRQPNRRFISRGLYLPGRVADAMHHLVMCIDTSGSITAAMLKAYMSEVAGALDEGLCNKLTVIYADAAVNLTEEYFPGDLVVPKAVGGGGTCFNGTFRWIAEYADDATCVIYLTDMMTSSFGQDPGCPVLWAHYAPGHYGTPTPPFGVVIKIDSPEN